MAALPPPEKPKRARKTPAAAKAPAKRQKGTAGQKAGGSEEGDDEFLNAVRLAELGDLVVEILDARAVELTVFRAAVPNCGCLFSVTTMSGVMPRWLMSRLCGVR